MKVTKLLTAAALALLYATAAQGGGYEHCSGTLERQNPQGYLVVDTCFFARKDYPRILKACRVGKPCTVIGTIGLTQEDGITLGKIVTVFKGLLRDSSINSTKE